MLFTLYPIKNIRDDDPFENHVETVAHYIELVQSSDVAANMKALLMCMFMQYIVAMSWKKMRRRISHWFAQGFIYYLGKVDGNALRAVVQPTVINLRNDRQLS